MGCACNKRGAGAKFVWTSSDGSVTVEYDKEVIAKAKVMRKGGSYVRKEG